MFRDNLGRMDENDEIEENQDQKEVRKILRASVLGYSRIIFTLIFSTLYFYHIYVQIYKNPF